MWAAAIPDRARATTISSGKCRDQRSCGIAQGCSQSATALSRYTQPNQEINCYAAAAKYLEDNPDAKADLYPAWLHYVDIGKAEGRAWPSGLCNTCSETTHGGTNGGVQTNCDSSNYNGRLGQCFNQGSTTDGSHHPSLYDGGIGVHGEQYVESHSGGGLAGTAGFYTYEEGLRCTDKCRGMHDAAVAEMVGATSCHLEGDICHGGHYGHGFANFQNPTGDTLTFKLHSCNAGRHRIAITYALASDDPPRPLSVTVNGHPPVGTLNGGGGGIDRGAQVFTGRGTGMVESALQFPATGSWTTWGKVFSEVMLLDGENEITLTAIQNSGANIDVSAAASFAPSTGILRRRCSTVFGGLPARRPRDRLGLRRSRQLLHPLHQQPHGRLG